MATMIRTRQTTKNLSMMSELDIESDLLPFLKNSALNQKSLAVVGLDVALVEVDEIFHSLEMMMILLRRPLPRLPQLLQLLPLGRRLLRQLLLPLRPPLLRPPLRRLLQQLPQSPLLRLLNQLQPPNLAVIPVGSKSLLAIRSCASS